MNGIISSAGSAIRVRIQAHRLCRPPHTTLEANEAGFTLIEVMVSLALIGIVMSATAAFLVRSTASTHYLDQRQIAAHLASNALETVNGLSGTDLVSGRDTASVASQWTAAMTTGPDSLTSILRNLDQVVDPDTSPTNTHSALPVTVVNGAFTQNSYVGLCWQTTDSSNCALANKAVAAAYSLYAVVVAESWTSNECSRNTCWLVSSTLAAADTAEPVFATTPTVAPSPSATAQPTITAIPSSTPTPSATTVTPCLTCYVLWADRRTNGTSTSAALTVTNSKIQVSGVVHSNADIYLANSNGVLGSPRMEYATTITDNNPPMALLGASMQANPGTPPHIRVVNDYRPGGSAATAAGAGYRKVTTCSGGNWNYNENEVSGATIIYVPCSVTISGPSVIIPALVVAEDTITITATRAQIGTPSTEAVSGLLTPSTATPAINIKGGIATIYGNVQALAGNVTVDNSPAATMNCGITANSIFVTNTPWLGVEVNTDCLQ